VPSGFRRDCGFVGINQDQCESKGCCWSPDKPGFPWCFYSNGAVLGYGVSSVTPTDTGLTGSLQLVNGGGFYGVDISPLHFAVTYETADRVRIRIIDPSRQRYEVPTSLLPVPNTTVSSVATNYAVSYTNYPFGISVTRKADGAVIFNSTTTGAFNGLVFEDQYLELSTQLPSNPNVYGLGEHVRNLRLDPDGSLHTMWARDAPTPVDQNIYGTHPFYCTHTQAHTSYNAGGS
jgi:alpha-glucosidase